MKRLRSDKKFVTLREAENFAQKKIDKKIFNWLQSGAEDNFTTFKNIVDLNNIRIKPFHLKKVKRINLTTNFFGKKISSPLILSPMGHQTQFHKDGEIETAKAISSINSVGVFGTQGRMSLNDLRKNNKKTNLCWTIFPFGSLKWIDSQIRNAEKNKCIAIVVCVDANIRSHRYLDRESRYDARTVGRRTNPNPPNQEAALFYDWELIKFIKKKTKLPVIVKGILSIEDALNCIRLRCDGLWISNHGGRMFNSGISGVEALREIKKKVSNKKIKIFVDGGVRRGSDILKLLCLGADFIGIGRPAIHGLICDGKEGVKNIFNVLNSELLTAMTNGGFKDFSECKNSRIKFK